MTDQIQQLQRRVSEQVLARAEADPQWKQQFLEDPQTATSEIPGAQQLQEMYESATPTQDQPPEATIPTAREEYLQLRRSLTEKILDKAASDPQWKQRLLDDRDTVLREANFPESQRLRELAQEEAEVQGHGGFTGPDRVNVSSISYVDDTPPVWNPPPYTCICWVVSASYY